MTTPMDIAARVMLAALRAVQDDYRDQLRSAYDNGEADEIDSMLQEIDAAIKQAESAGVTL